MQLSEDLSRLVGKTMNKQSKQQNISHFSSKNEEFHFGHYFVKKHKKKTHFRTKNNKCKNAFSHLYLLMSYRGVQRQS